MNIQFFLTALVALLPLVVAFVVYGLLFFSLKKILTKEPFRRLLISVSRPVLFLFLFIAALTSLEIAHFPPRVDRIFAHALVVGVIAAVGIALGNLTREIYRYIQEKYATDSLEDFSKRSFLTQIQVLFRATLFAIAVLTLAAISMTFPQIRSFGIGILGSAGILGIALGIAAKPLLLNLMAGFQIAFTKLIKMGDVVVIDGEQGKIEQMSLTHVVIRTWDLRRKIVPISDFIDKPFENWSGYSTELTAVATIYCDYRTSLSTLREKFLSILQANALWDKKSWKLEVIDVTDAALKIRLSMSTGNPTDASNLQSIVREELIAFLQKTHEEYLPRVRYEEKR